MFKKPPQAKASANIKSSERRNLLATICKEYGINPQGLSKDDETAILPSPLKQASFQSLQDKGTIYFDTNECPVWFKTRDSPLYPTLYTLWKAAYLLPIVLTNSHVILKLTNHANLMLPGCIPPFDRRATRGALVGVASYEKPSVIMAIGHCSLNLTQFDNVVGRQGTAVTIIHSFDDCLFKLNDVDYAIPDLVNTIKPGENETESLNLNEDEVTDTNTNTEPDNETENETISEAQNAVENVSESVAQLSVEDIDNLFIRAFIQSVKNNTLEVPMAPSKFMADYILKNFPRCDPKFCNIKKSSWKKTAKFLKALEKLKYISLKGKGDDVTIVGITIGPDIVSAYVPHKTISDGKGPSVTPSKKDLDNKLKVINLYKPTNKSRMIFNRLDKNYNALYERKDISLLLKEYIDVLKLTDKTNPKMVVIDDALRNVVGGKDESVPRDKLLTLFLNTFSPFYTILKPKQEYSLDSPVHKGEPPKIKILTKTIMGRKKSTNVLNFEKFHIKPTELAEDLKTLCSGSTSVGESIHNPNLTEVMVQGAHGPAITEYLKKRGVPIGFIDFEDKSKGKRK